MVAGESRHLIRAELQTDCSTRRARPAEFVDCAAQSLTAVPDPVTSVQVDEEEGVEDAEKKLDSADAAAKKEQEAAAEVEKDEKEEGEVGSGVCPCAGRCFSCNDAAITRVHDLQIHHRLDAQKPQLDMLPFKCRQQCRQQVSTIASQLPRLRWRRRRRRISEDSVTEAGTSI